MHLTFTDGVQIAMVETAKDIGVVVNTFTYFLCSAEEDSLVLIRSPHDGVKLCRTYASKLPTLLLMIIGPQINFAALVVASHLQNI